ncbi:MAG: pilus assembly protein PilP [Burkholderiaceae bacterium]|jgi:Tfp pilus assembly protein PilP
MKIIYSALCLSVMLSGCVLELVPEPDDLGAWVQAQRQQAQASARIDPLPAFPQRQLVANVANKDIFDPLRPYPASRTSKNVDLRLQNKYPLVGQPVEQMVFVGQFMQSGQRVALVRLGDRLIRAYKGDLIGVRAGRIASIEDSRLSFVEPTQNDIGKWTTRTGTLELK